ncbi:TetR/AcrR family transcriptional regulator C-terminal domain-containing protein [Streptomyces sp. NPDC056683]|uniref:TetR/AcrR family transcriptional regulator C-terminal domain-containing protein n=1 Tax=Streptomyces sp. NPDC056683 TaxID=3345910 RepID=UPI0036B5F720
MTEVGFTFAQAARAGMTTNAYTIGFVIEEQGVVPLPGERREGYDLEERARLMAGFPLAAEAGRELFDDYDQHFEEGLEIVIAGIGARWG